MRKTLSLTNIFLLSLTLAEGPLYAADRAVPTNSGDKVDVEQECSHVSNLEPSTSDMPSKKMPNDLADCNQDVLYYDTQSNSKATQADWNKVRACALTRNNSPILMMLYANGFGVKRDYNLAIKYACEQRHDDMGFGVDVMIEALVRRRASGNDSEALFERCDFNASTHSSGYCVIIQEGQKERSRVRRLNEISRSMGDRQAAAFEKLRYASQGFALSRSRNETDQSGSGRAMYMIAAEADEKELFLQDIEQCERGTVPEYTREQFTELDRKLNETYRSIMHTLIEGEREPLLGTGISKSSIKETQKTWLKFRDAWVEFGSTRYSKVPAHVWKAMLTERRIAQLEELQNSDIPLIYEK